MKACERDKGLDLEAEPTRVRLGRVPGVLLHAIYRRLGGRIESPEERHHFPENEESWWFKAL